MGKPNVILRTQEGGRRFVHSTLFFLESMLHKDGKDKSHDLIFDPEK